MPQISDKKTSRWRRVISAIRSSMHRGWTTVRNLTVNTSRGSDDMSADPKEAVIQAASEAVKTASYTPEGILAFDPEAFNKLCRSLGGIPRDERGLAPVEDPVAQERQAREALPERHIDPPLVARPHDLKRKAGPPLVEDRTEHSRPRD